MKEKCVCKGFLDYQGDFLDYQGEKINSRSLREFMYEGLA
jgi:hypothetical protein